MGKRRYRKIVVDDIEYKWVFGRTAIVIRDADGAVVAKPQVTDITGLSWDDIERGTYKGYFHLTPKDVADWIRAKKDILHEYA